MMLGCSGFSSEHEIIACQHFHLILMTSVRSLKYLWCLIHLTWTDIYLQ